MSHAVQSPAVLAVSRKRQRLLSYRNSAIITAFIDGALVVAASVAAGWGYHLWALGYVTDVLGYVGIGCNAAIVFVLFAKSQGLYRTNVLLSTRQLRSVAVTWIAVLLVISLLLFLLKLGASYSRGTIVMFGFLGLCLLLTSRALISSALHRALVRGTIASQHAIVIGQTDELTHYSAKVLLQRYGINELARFELPSTHSGDSTKTDLLHAAVRAARARGAELVVLALSWAQAAQDDIMRESMRALPLPVVLLPDRTASSVLARPIVEIGSGLAVEVQRAPLSLLELVTKRILDIVLAGTALVLLSPLLLVVSMAIKLTSRGSVIFRQHRRGFNERPFTIYKFRTMTVSENGNKVLQAQPNDERVTNLGFFLRALSIDELPQLINVLRGEMSLVGPRPHALAHDNEYTQLISNYAFRSHVKPGITGWAQVQGLRGQTKRLELMERRVDLDLWYISNWSIWLDLRILARTCVLLRRNPNAY